MKKKMSALVFNEEVDRYDIRFGPNDYYGGLWCGECFDVLVKGGWRSTRIECTNDDVWILMGVCAGDLNGLLVRI